MVPRLAGLMVVALLLSPAVGRGQAPTPSPEHQALGFWIGRWDLEGEAHPNPLFPEGEYRATMTAEWFQGGFHVMCDYDWTGALGPYRELNVLGYGTPVDGYEGYYQFFVDGFGSGSLSRGTRDGNIWTYINRTNLEGQEVTFRWTVTDESPGLITWTSEVSLDGGPWILAGEMRATRR